MKTAFACVLSAALIASHPVASAQILPHVTFSSGSIESVPHCGSGQPGVAYTASGPLENIARDGSGNLWVTQSSLISESHGRLFGISHESGQEFVSYPVGTPGGIVVDHNSIFVTTGNSAVPGLLSQPSGTITRFELETGARSLHARGLVMPNGLVKLPDGRMITSRDLGPGTGLTVVSPDGTLAGGFPAIQGANGLAYHPTRNTLFVSRVIDTQTSVDEISIGDHPQILRRHFFPGVSLLNAADDLTVASNGKVYSTHNIAGRVVEIDPESGAQCILSEQVPFASSIVEGKTGTRWENHLLVSSFTGKVFSIRLERG